MKCANIACEARIEECDPRAIVEWHDRKYCSLNCARWSSLIEGDEPQQIKEREEYERMKVLLNV